MSYNTLISIIGVVCFSFVSIQKDIYITSEDVENINKYLQKGIETISPPQPDPNPNPVPDWCQNTGFDYTQRVVYNLAKSIGLLESFEVNDHLSYNTGNISYWHEQHVSFDRLNLEFSVRKVILQKADSLKFWIQNHGDLDLIVQKWLAENKESPIYKAYKEKIICPKSIYKADSIPRNLLINPISLIIKDQYLSIYPQEIEKAQQKLNEYIAKEDVIPDNINDIKSLARYLGFQKENFPNLHLFFYGGDFSFWAKQNLTKKELLAKFAGIRAVLDAANRENFIIKDKGDLTYCSNQIAPYFSF